MELQMRHYNIICILAALALVASACAKVVPDEPGTRSIIGFNTVCTKAVTSKYPTTVPFRSTAFSYSGTWDANKSSATQYIDEELVKYNSTYSYWITYDGDTEKAYSWPGGDTKLAFFSYSPSSLKGRVSVSTDGVGISSWDVTSDTGDILIADIAQDKTKNESLAGYTGVPTLFKHKLSRIVFEFGIADDASDDTKIRLTSIVLKDVCFSGSYSRGGYADDKWTPSAPESSSWSWSLFAGDLELSKSLSTDKEFNMIPQSLLATGTTHPELVIGYDISTDGSSWESKTATCYFDENLRQESWEKGKKYTYTIYIGVGLYPIKFTGGVTEWSNGDTSTITIG